MSHQQLGINRLEARSATIGRFIVPLFLLCQIAGCGTKPEPEAKKAVEAAQHIADGLREGQSHVICDVLTDSQHEDVNRIVHRFAEKVPPALWEKGFRVAEVWGRVLKEKRDFALNCPHLGKGHQKLEDHGDELAASLIHLAESDFSRLDKLKTADVKDLLKQIDPHFMKAAPALFALTPNEQERQLALAGYNKALETFTEASFALDEHGDDWAVVNSATVDSGVMEMRFIKDGDRWVPEIPADDWRKGIDEADRWLNEFDAEAMPQLVLLGAMMDALVISSLESALAAESQADFDALFKDSPNPLLPVFFFAAEKNFAFPQ